MTAVVAVDAVVPAPDVLADAVVAAPFFTWTVNWSPATRRELMDFESWSVGVVGPLVNVHVMSAPGGGARWIVARQEGSRHRSPCSVSAGA